MSRRFLTTLVITAWFGLVLAGSAVHAQSDADAAEAKDTAPAAATSEQPEDHSTEPTEAKEPAAAHEPASAEHGGEHHDTDPTHANVTDALYEVTDFRTDLAFFTAIVFLLLLAGLYSVAWKPIMQGLEKRERRIAGNIEQAEQAAQQATAKLAQYEAKLATAAEEAQQIVAEARKDAEAAGQKLIASAQEEAARQRDRAVADIESAKRVALSELAGQSADVAMSVAQRIVGREIKADDHQSLIQEMLSKLPSNN
ncbi:F0F1 ATP synthase subunit B [Aureliella helgolandensis]|uniref:ATP synthase subunit b n=1 Tax=Aureliella helgolandensis TaxID=2527968 RepID=A0A518GE60_9BACT|nr:F0F1 ATP synthase subunit B [Aureliella helgolandensis]QDV26882.1 ATP synthase subunit b, sodium ion specific [Aureliella helgolandensis]